MPQSNNSTPGLCRRRLAVLILAIAGLLATTMSSAQAQVDDSSTVAVPDRVLQVLAEQGFVELEVVLQAPENAASVAVAAIDQMSVARGQAVDVTATFETLPLVVVRVESIADLESIAASTGVRAIGVTELVAEGAQLGAQTTDVVLAPTTERAGAYSHHDVGITGQGQTVAVLDSGIDTDHPDLASSLSFEACFMSGRFGRCADGSVRMLGPGSSEDDSGHGTFVASVIASDGVVAPLGAAPGATIESYKFLNDRTLGSFTDMLGALDYIIANRPDVSVVTVNAASAVRFAGACDVLDGSPVVEMSFAAIQTLRARGVTVVMPAGNQSDNAGMGFPACLSNVISVANTLETPQRAPRSNTSAATDVGAPGTDITVSNLNGTSTVVTGTSVASPLVAACVALFRGHGITDVSALEDRVRTSPSTITDTPHQVPWLNCYRPCAGQTPNRIAAWGQQGTPQNDVLIGTRGPETLQAAGGDDIVCGGLGRDTIDGASGSDQLFGDGGGDRILGGAGRDIIHGGSGPDRIWGGSGRDLIKGQGGQDVVYGQGGSDTIEGNDQSDKLYGGPGNDVLSGAAGKDRLYGEGGDDQLFGGVNSDLLQGGAGTDIGNGGPGRDWPFFDEAFVGCFSIEQRISC